MKHPKELSERELRELEILGDQLMRTGTMKIEQREGTYKCPRCGKDMPHDHPAYVVRNAAPEGTDIGDTTCPDGTPCLTCAQQPVVQCLCMCHYEF